MLVNRTSCPKQLITVLSQRVGESSLGLACPSQSHSTLGGGLESYSLGAASGRQKDSRDEGAVWYS